MLASPRHGLEIPVMKKKTKRKSQDQRLKELAALSHSRAVADLYQD